MAEEREERHEDAPTCCAGASVTILGEAWPPLVRTALGAVRLMGKTVGMARRMARHTAAGLASASHKAVAIPAKIRSCGAKMIAGESEKSQRARVEAEIAQQEGHIEELCAKMGRRLCELGQEDASTLPDDAQLAAFMSAMRDVEEKIGELNAELLRLRRTPAETEQEEERAASPAPPEVAESHEEGPPATQPPERAEAEPSEQEAPPEASGFAVKVAAVIRERPDGLSLVEIADRLGVPWQALIRVVKGLVEDEQVRKENGKYYPV